MTLPAPGAVPPIVLSVAPLPMIDSPHTVAIDTVPVMSVPIRLPSTRLPVESVPIRRQRVSPELEPASTLAAPGTVPPIVLFGPSTSMPLFC